MVKSLPTPTPAFSGYSHEHNGSSIVTAAAAAAVGGSVVMFVELVL